LTTVAFFDHRSFSEGGSEGGSEGWYQEEKDKK
jgi:hypothetical protein